MMRFNVVFMLHFLQICFDDAGPVGVSSCNLGRKPIPSLMVYASC